MITLARHIELLLLEYDCVIVPGLGGFIANHVEAHYTGTDEEQFLPPYRTIGFNPQLQINDGLLVQSYMSAYDASYPSAYLQMEQDIEKLLKALEMQGEYVLDNLGVLKKGLNQSITFVAPEEGALTPSLFGLYTCGVKSLERVKKEKEILLSLQMAEVLAVTKNEEERPTKPKRRRDLITIHISRRWLDVSIATAAAILLLFCVSYSAIKTVSSETDTVIAAVYPIAEIGLFNKYEEAIPPAESRKIEQKATAGRREPSAKANSISKLIQSATPAQAPQETESHFSIVLASYVSENNANAYIATLAKAGFSEGRFVKLGKVSRILYSNYTTEAEAQKALIELRQQNKEFAEAWVLKL